MKSKTLVIFFAIMLIALLNGRVPFLNAPAIAAPRDYCDGFQNPPVPSLSEEPFVPHPAPSSKYFLPGVIADWDNDGDLDLPYAENLGAWNFRAVNAIDNLIEGSGYGAVLAKNRNQRPPISKRFPQVPTGEQYYNFHGVAAIDFDGDGRQDFIAAPYYQQGVPILLFHNLGNWQFEFARQDFFRTLLGFNATSTWYSETIIPGDFTGDGFNDVYIPYYTYTDPYQSVFLRSTGSAYVEEALLRGIDIPSVPFELRPEGAQAVDIDDDGDLDIYVAHHLFINDGNGNFTDAREAYGLPILPDEGIAFIDYDNDGSLDLYVRSGSPDQQLFRNTGHGFANTSVTSGLACLTQNAMLFWGDSWADLDNDGDLDLLYISDYPVDPQYHVLLNQGDGTFQLGFTGHRFIHLTATADFDLDGDLDVSALGEIDENKFGTPASSNVLAVVPVDEQGRLNEFGATVRVRSGCDGKAQTRVIGANNVYLAQGEYATHFAVAGNCAYDIEVAFIRRGAQPRQVVTIQYDPAIEGSRKIFVSRLGADKQPYPGYRFFSVFPTILKDAAPTDRRLR